MCDRYISEDSLKSKILQMTVTDNIFNIVEETSYIRCMQEKVMSIYYLVLF